MDIEPSNSLRNVIYVGIAVIIAQDWNQRQETRGCPVYISMLPTWFHALLLSVLIQNENFILDLSEEHVDQL